MSLRALDLTTALRPSLLSEETLLFVQNAVGLYVGKAKLEDYQNGQAYLTTHRACYVDNDKPRERAVGINLRDVERCELYAGFLKSSPKVTLIPKSARLGASAISGGQDARTSTSQSRGPSQQTPLDATWICPICSFSNPVPSNFDPNSANANTPLPPCLACGIKPPLVLVIKAAVSGLSAQQRTNSVPSFDGNGQQAQTPGVARGVNRCARCTFENHPSLRICEICGEPLSTTTSAMRALSRVDRSHSASPAPAGAVSLPTADTSEGIKFAFRDGGEKVFIERLKGALSQRKWLLESAPAPPPNANTSSRDSAAGPRRPGQAGIAGLERRGLDVRRNNELVIGNAFEDLAALMASAKQIVALAEQFSTQTGQGSSDAATLLSQMDLTTTTREHLSGSRASAGTLYVTELARTLAEFLTDDRRGVLRSEGGVMSLVDVWAVFNRTRSGVELVSPADLAAAAEQCERLSLPIRLRRFKSGLLVIQDRGRSDERTIASILAWLAAIRAQGPSEPVSWDFELFGRGVTVVEAAEHFGWSVGVAAEELEMAEQAGALCREGGLEGARFWENWLAEGRL